MNMARTKVWLIEDNRLLREGIAAALDDHGDVVDAIIEKVLESGGSVVFAPSGSLTDRDKIVLLPRRADGN